MKKFLFIVFFIFNFYGLPISSPQDLNNYSFPPALIIIKNYHSIKCRVEATLLPQKIDSDENDRIRDELFNIDKGLDTIGIKPGMKVGEVGAGWGYLVFKLARLVGPTGIVFANDIKSNALKILQKRAVEKGFHNIKTVLGTNNDPRFPTDTLEIVFMHDTFHLLEKPVELLNNLARSLKKHGKTVIIEWEREKGIIDRNGNLIHPSEYRTTQEFIKLFNKTVFKIDRMDRRTLPYLIIFILSVKD